MQRPGGERAAFGSSSSRTAAWHPRDHESRMARWRLREQSTGKLPRKGLEHSKFRASRWCTRRGLPSAAPVQKLQPGTPRDHEPRTAPWRLHEQSTGRPPRRGLEHGNVKASRRHRRARRCTACGLPSAAPVQKLQPGTPRDHEPRTAPWRLHEQSTGRPPRRGLEHGNLKASRRHRRARRCTVRGLPSAAPAGTARHVSTAQLREANVRGPSSVARAFGIHIQRP